MPNQNRSSRIADQNSSELFGCGGSIKSSESFVRRQYSEIHVQGTHWHWQNPHLRRKSIISESTMPFVSDVSLCFSTVSVVQGMPNLELPAYSTGYHGPNWKECEDNTLDVRNVRCSKKEPNKSLLPKEINRGSNKRNDSVADEESKNSSIFPYAIQASRTKAKFKPSKANELKHMAFNDRRNDASKVPKRKQSNSSKFTDSEQSSTKLFDRGGKNTTHFTTLEEKMRNEMARNPPIERSFMSDCKNRRMKLIDSCVESQCNKISMQDSHCPYLELCRNSIISESPMPVVSDVSLCFSTISVIQGMPNLELPDYSVFNSAPNWKESVDHTLDLRNEKASKNESKKIQPKVTKRGSAKKDHLKQYLLKKDRASSSNSSMLTIRRTSPLSNAKFEPKKADGLMHMAFSDGRDARTAKLKLQTSLFERTAWFVLFLLVAAMLLYRSEISRPCKCI